MNLMKENTKNQKGEIILKELCNQKINEIILDPPRFQK